MKLPAPDAAGRTTPLESQAPAGPVQAAAPGGRPFEVLIDKRGAYLAAMGDPVELPPIGPPPPEAPFPDRTLVEQVLGVEEDRDDEPWTTSIVIVPTAAMAELPIDSVHEEEIRSQPLDLVADARDGVELVLAGEGPPISPLDGRSDDRTQRSVADQLPVITAPSDVLLSEISPEPTAIGSRPGEGGTPSGPSAAAIAGTFAALPVKISPEVVSPIAGSRTTEPQPMTVDTARLIHRVARSFAAVHHGSGAIRMKLSPPALGALRLEVLVQDGKLIARLETETAEAQRSLVEGLPALRERLAEQGLRIEHFEVDLFSQHSGTPQQSADPDWPEQGPAPARARRMPQVAEGVVARMARPGEPDPKRLNVIV